MENGYVDMQCMSAPKSVTCTHLHAHFQSTFSTRVHKNLCTHYCEHTWARMHTNFSLTRVIIPTSPDFLLKLMKNSIQSSLTHFGQIWSILDRFDPFWTDLIHFGQIWSNLMKLKKLSFLSSWYKALCILMNSTSVQNLIVLILCIKLSTAENSGF